MVTQVAMVKPRFEPRTSWHKSPCLAAMLYCFLGVAQGLDQRNYSFICSLTYSFNFQVSAEYPLFQERTYGLPVFLQTSPDGFEERSSRIKVPCRTVKVIRFWDTNRPGPALQQWVSFLSRGQTQAQKRLNAHCLPGSTGIVVMLPWHPFKTMSS